MVPSLPLTRSLISRHSIAVREQVTKEAWSSMIVFPSFKYKEIEKILCGYLC
jgi:hypothetical protein